MKGVSSEVILSMRDVIDKSMLLAHFKIEFTKKGKKNVSTVKIIENEFCEIDGSDLKLKVNVECDQNIVNFSFTGKCMIYDSANNKLFIFCDDCIYIYGIEGIGLKLIKKFNLKWGCYNGLAIFQQHLVLYDLGSLKYLINI